MVDLRAPKKKIRENHVSVNLIALNVQTYQGQIQNAHAVLETTTRLDEEAINTCDLPARVAEPGTHPCLDGAAPLIAFKVALD